MVDDPDNSVKSTLATDRIRKELKQRIEIEYYAKYVICKNKENRAIAHIYSFWKKVNVRRTSQR